MVFAVCLCLSMCLISIPDLGDRPCWVVGTLRFFALLLGTCRFFAHESSADRAAFDLRSLAVRKPLPPLFRCGRKRIRSPCFCIAVPETTGDGAPAQTHHVLNHEVHCAFLRLKALPVSYLFSGMAEGNQAAVFCSQSNKQIFFVRGIHFLFFCFWKTNTLWRRV